MLKSELEIKVKELQEQVENLESVIDSLNGLYGELESENAELQDNINTGIKNVDDFKFRLNYELRASLGNGAINKIEQFIDEYIQYYN